MPAGIGQSALQKMTYGTTSTDTVESAVGIKPFQDVRLEPDLYRSCLGITACTKAAI